MQAIVTKYHGPGNVRGSRVSAKAQGGRVMIGWDDALDTDDNHAAAAQALCKRLNWRGRLVGGALPDGTGNVYTFDRDFRSSYDGPWTPPIIVY